MYMHILFFLYFPSKRLCVPASSRLCHLDQYEDPSPRVFTPSPSNKKTEESQPVVEHTPPIAVSTSMDTKGQRLMTKSSTKGMH